MLTKVSGQGSCVMVTNRKRTIQPSARSVNNHLTGDTIGDRVKALREAAELELRPFAEYVARMGGFRRSHSAVAKYESGSEPPAEFIAAVCRAFGVNPGWILLGDEPIYATSPTTAERIVAEVRETMARYEEGRAANDDNGDEE